MSRHRVQPRNTILGRLVKAGLWTILAMLGGLLAICIGVFLSLRPWG